MFRSMPALETLFAPALLASVSLFAPVLLRDWWRKGLPALAASVAGAACGLVALTVAVAAPQLGGFHVAAAVAATVANVVLVAAAFGSHHQGVGDRDTEHAPPTRHDDEWT